MNIAIFFTASPDSGGAFQYQLSLLNVLKKTKKHKILVLTGNKEVVVKFNKDFEIVNLSWITNKIRFLKHHNKKIKTIDDLNIKEISKTALKIKWGKNKRKKRISLFDKFTYKIIELYLKSKKIDLIFWPAPLSAAFKINIPYVFTVYDVEHRRVPEFPELSAFGEYERREHLYENGLKKALAITTESEQGKRNIINYYNINKEKIFPIKLLPPTYLANKVSKEMKTKVIKKYKLPKEYFYYPAQFWPHKNHILILKAISLLRKRGINVHVVFSGSDKKKWGVLRDLKEAAIRLGISDLIHYVGYVSNEEISTLYKNSKALVMTSKLGPSNIPYLEAFKLRTPVIAMNVPGIKDQVQDAAIMVDPDNEKDLAKAMKTILTNRKKVKKLITNGEKVLERWTEEDFEKTLLKIIDYAEQRMEHR